MSLIVIGIFLRKLEVARAFESLENEEMVSVPKDLVDTEDEVITLSSGDEEEIEAENTQEALSCEKALQVATSSRKVLAERNI
jgi:hypothetical protein